METVKKIGKKKTDDLWYRIGKESGTRYSLFVGKRKIPSSVLPLIIQHVFNTLASVGMTFAKDVKYSNFDNSFFASGENCVVCNKTQSGFFMAGLVSGILSMILDKDIGAKPCCTNCPNGCKIIASPNIKDECKMNLDELRPSLDYSKLNFPLMNHRLSDEFKSFSDLLKFKQITVDERGCMNFKNQVLVPTEIGLTQLSFRNYSKIGLENFYKKSLIRISENLAQSFFNGSNSPLEKIKSLKIILSAFGWGLLFYKRDKNKVIFKFQNPPISKFGSLYRALILNGFINIIFNKKFKIKKDSEFEMIFEY